MTLKISVSLGENNLRLNPEVQRLYDKYKDEMEFWFPHADFNPDDKRFYVYAWFTKGLEKKIFYVGKGTGNRAKHILTEIQLYEENPQKYKGRRYKLIKDKSGIDYEILIDGITNYEAEIYEYCMMREYVNRGEILLNFVDMPINEDNETTIEETQNTIPTIYKDKFYERYLDDYSSPTFDTILGENLLSAYFYDAWTTYTKKLSEDRINIVNWIVSSGGAVYKSIGKNTKCVIIQGKYPYEHFLHNHQNGLAVYSIKDVLNYISTHPTPVIKINKSSISVPKYDIVQRDTMRQYLKDMQDDINKLANTPGRGFEEEMKGVELKKKGKDLEAILQFYVSTRKGADFPEMYIQFGILLRKYGLFDEEIMILKAGLKNIDYEGSKVRIRERYVTAIRIRDKDLENIAEQQTKMQKVLEKATATVSQKKPVGRAILQMDDHMNVIAKFETISDAVKTTGINSKSIRDAANGVQKHAGGFVWKYADK